MGRESSIPLWLEVANGSAHGSRYSRQVLHALSLWNCTGYINWTPQAARFVYRELEGHTTKFIGCLMNDHVRSGGKIHQIRETREPWLEWDFHYDLYVPVGKREVYIETRLVEDDPDDCCILVANTHDP